MRHNSTAPAASTGPTSWCATFSQVMSFCTGTRSGLADRRCSVFSEAVGPLTADSLVWQARGTFGRARAEITEPAPSWKLPLRGYTALSQPVDQAVLRSVESDLRAVLRDLVAAQSGSLYFPFAFSDSRPVRTTQGYLVKFPAALLQVIPGLEAVPGGPRRELSTPGVGEEPTPAGSERTGSSGRGAGYIADAVLRRALEAYAVSLATAYYQRAGWKVEDVEARRSYDLLLTQPDGAERHVEVKGSSRDATDVELTIAEVEHARGPVPCDLFVVANIEYAREESGGYRSWGGTCRLWSGWQAADDLLRPTRFRHTLPNGAESISF